jgi:hypothetical protein
VSFFESSKVALFRWLLLLTDILIRFLFIYCVYFYLKSFLILTFISRKYINSTKYCTTD